jgi:hypothetical protein
MPETQGEELPTHPPMSRRRSKGAFGARTGARRRRTATNLHQAHLVVYKGYS